MYNIVHYAGMIAFEERTSAYARALEANIVAGDVVLDIGCGPGILSLLACRASAAKVYAVEPDDVIELARETATDNGLLDRIEFIQAMSTEIDLPQQVDGIVTDIHGVLPLHGKSFVSILDARDRFLKPGGWIIPARETIWGALACCPDLHGSLTEAWDTPYRFNFDKARTQAVNGYCAARLKPEQLLGTPQRWAVLEYKDLNHLDVKGDMSWVVEVRTRVHGVCAWFDSETAPGFGFSNSPAATGPYVYRHAFFPWPEAVELMPGDKVRVSLQADFVEQDYVWSWNTDVTTNSGEVKARFGQSTFLGSPVSPNRLRRRGASFVPAPKEDWSVDYKVLDLMRQGMTLGEIAKTLLAEFPARFKDLKAALTRAGDLSERYSE